MGFRLQLTKERVDVLSTVLSKVMEDALSDRSPLESEWRDNDDMYEGKVAPSASEFPWPGSSAYFVPLPETYINAMSSRLTDAVHTPEPTLTVRNLTNEWADPAKAVEEFLEWVVREQYRLRDVSIRHTHILSKHGTSFLYNPWQVLLEDRMVYNIEQDDVIRQTQVRTAGPKVIVPAIWDVLLPKEADDVMTAPWKAIRWRLTEDDLEQRRIAGVYDGPMIDKVVKFSDTTLDASTTEVKQRLGFATSIVEPFYEVWEWMGLFKLPGHKHAMQIIVPFHLKTKTPLSLLANFYPHQRIPLFGSQFQPTDYGAYGRGVCRMLKSGSKEVNDMHKNRVDNAMLANTRGYKVRKSWMLTQIKSFRMWPGRMIPVAEMDDFQEFAMGAPYQSTLDEELLTRRTMEQQVGLSDFSLTGGAPDSLKRVGATPALVAMQESGRVLNFRLNNIRSTYAMLGAWTMEMYAHFRPVDVFEKVLGSRARFLYKFLDASPEVLRGNMVIEVTASSATVNREMEKQSDMLLVNLWSNYATRYLELAQLVLNPQAPPPLIELGKSIASAANVMMRDILRDFNKRNNAFILAELDDVLSGRSSAAQGQPGMADILATRAGTSAQLAQAAATRSGLGQEGANVGSLLGAGGT